MVDGGGDAGVVVDIDAVDRGVLGLIDEGDEGKAEAEFLDDLGVEGVDEEDAAIFAFLQLFDLGECGVIGGGDLGGDEVDIDLDVVELGEFRDSGEDLFAGAFVFTTEVFFGIGADEDGEAGCFFGLTSGGASALEMGVSDIGGELEDLGSGGGADSGVIGEAARNGGSGKTETIGNYLLINFGHVGTQGEGVDAPLAQEGRMLHKIG